MKKTPLSWLFLLTLVLMLSCNPHKKALRKMMEGCDTVELATRKVPGASGDIPFYTSDSFANQAADAFTISSLQENHSRLLSLQKEPFQNIHDNSRIDTIYHFSGRKDSIKFYRSQEKDLMIYFSIADPKLDLHRCVRPGISKKAFLDLFGITPPVGDIIKIANPDQTLIFIFHFKEDKLQRIRSDIYFG